ncbi:type II toxin-antitoxin system PemK/MazF family toxin [Paenibacillus barengoltzii]|uniref:type II toxin-antitoxin system PemK/MazF family toxin n=1 Tax=Paenibacillus barengoltzii TaxID=343517 RepID=UPI002DB96D52|nr:type II toxin-antitoxin system PemK/MazF family toxin [Paenibacillus barengoltzii]MEC2345008.1 type II toxin-antitoxin system PemK/MazF family toxin [Paenibacillus barengoltzii]
MLAVKHTTPSYKQKIIKRGDIYMCHLPKEHGSVQANYRPVIILQNDVGNRFSPTTMIAPISRKDKSLPTHVKINEGVGGMICESFILCEQIRTIDKQLLGKYIGSISPHTSQFKAIEDAILISLGFQIGV